MDLGVLTDLQAAARDGVLAQAMSGYIRWLAPQIDDLKSTLWPEIQRIRDEARSEGVGQAHDRHPTNYAHLVAGLNLFFQFAVDAGALSAEEAVGYRCEGIEALQRVILGQAGFLDSDDEATRFLELLSAALTGGKCHLCDIGTQ